MKDNQGTELVRGDLVLLTIDTPVEHPAQLIIYLDNKVLTYMVDYTDDNEVDCQKAVTINTVHYYPISEEGLEVANYDAGVVVEHMHRQKEFEVTNVDCKHLLKFDSAGLRGYSKTLYDSIQDLIATAANVVPPEIEDISAPKTAIFQVENNGEWAGVAPTYTYQWYVNGALKEGQVTTVLNWVFGTPADIYCEVTATNLNGTVSENSNIIEYNGT